MPRKVVADVDDIAQLRAAWTELIQLAEQLGWKKEDVSRVVGGWAEDLMPTVEE